MEIHDDTTDEVKTNDSFFFADHLQEMDMYPVFLDGNHSLVKVTNEDAPDKKLLVIKDSFAHCMVPFLSEHYSEIYMVDLRYFRSTPISQLIEQNDIDETLILYGLDNLINDTNVMWLK